MPPQSAVGTLFWPRFLFVARQLPVPEALMGWARGWVYWGYSLGIGGSHTVHPVAKRWAWAPELRRLVQIPALPLYSL